MPCQHRGRVEVQLHLFLIWVLDRGKWPLPHPSHFTSRKDLWYPCIKGWVGPGPVWMGVENRKFFSHRGSNPEPPSLQLVTTKVKIKVKVKFTLEQAMKAQRKSRCIALLFLQPRH